MTKLTIPLVIAVAAGLAPATAIAHDRTRAWWTVVRAERALGTVTYKTRDGQTRRYGEDDVQCVPIRPVRLAPYTGDVIAKHFRCEVWARGWDVKGPTFRLHALRNNRFSVERL